MNNLLLKQLNDDVNSHKNNELRLQLAKVKQREKLHEQHDYDITERDRYIPHCTNYFISPKRIININNICYREEEHECYPRNITYNENISSIEKYNVQFIRVSIHIPDMWHYNYKVIPVSVMDNKGITLCLIDINTIPTSDITLKDGYGTMVLYCGNTITKIITIQFPYDIEKINDIVNGNVIQYRMTHKKN